MNDAQRLYCSVLDNVNHLHKTAHMLSLRSVLILTHVCTGCRIKKLLIPVELRYFDHGRTRRDLAFFLETRFFNFAALIVYFICSERV